MKLNSFIFLASVFSITLSCNSQTSETTNLLVSEKGIIVSCTRCGCMDDVLKKYLESRSNQEIRIYGDESCFPTLQSAEYIRITQRQMDSLYKSNFNLVLFKKKGKKVNYRVIQTDEAPNFERIAQKYFE